MRTASHQADTGRIAPLRNPARVARPANPPKASGHRLPFHAPKTDTVVVIERRAFVRDCIQSILAEAAGLEGRGLGTVDEFLAHGDHFKTAVVVLCAIGGGSLDVRMQLSQLQAAATGTPVVVMSDVDDPEFVLSVMNNGAHGFMPADICLEVAAHALRLVAAGGQYFPAGSLLAARQRKAGSSSPAPGPHGLFTRRQMDVINALRKGKANKIIAYELNMCESTVKVHVRNIMKKLNAKNRTEVAYIAAELFKDNAL